MPRACWALLLLLGASLSPSLAQAAPTAAKIVPRELGRGHPLRQGVVFCRRAQWTKARSFFLQVKQKQLLQLARKDRPLLYLYLGLSYIHLLQKKEGMQAFEKALLLDECTRLPGHLDLSPQVREDFRRFRRPFEKLCARKKLQALRKRLAVRRKKPEKPAQKKLYSKGVRLAAWLVLGSGGVALASAFVVGGLSFMTEIRRNEVPFTPEGTAEYMRLHQLAEQRALVANVLFVTAGTMLFTGLALQLSQLIVVPVPKPPKPARSLPRKRPKPAKAPQPATPNPDAPLSGARASR